MAEVDTTPVEKKNVRKATTSLKAPKSTSAASKEAPKEVKDPVAAKLHPRGGVARKLPVSSTSVPKKNGGKTTPPPSVAETGKQKKPHRFRPGTVALRQIRRYQKGGELLIPRLPFLRLCREAGQDLLSSGDAPRWQPAAFAALQEAAEAKLVEFFEDCVLAMAHRKRLTVDIRDAKLIRGLEEKRHAGHSP